MRCIDQSDFAKGSDESATSTYSTKRGVLVRQTRRGINLNLTICSATRGSIPHYCLRASQAPMSSFLNSTLRDHRVGDAKEARDVRSGDKVSVLAELLRKHGDLGVHLVYRLLDYLFDISRRVVAHHVS